MKKKFLLTAVIMLCMIFIPSCGESVSEEELPLSAKYIYSTLSEKEKPVYAKLYRGVTNYKYKVKIGGMKSDEFTDLFLKFYCSGADFFYLNSDIKYMVSGDGTVTECYFTYDNYSSSTASMREQLDAAAEKALENITDSMTDAEKLKVLHDYLIDNTVYDAEASDCDNIYGALIKHRTHCQGFSKTMCFFCDKLGIPSMLVTGDAGGPHMWNMVQADGKWYNLDVTWDNPEHGKRNYTNYFLISDREISATHTKDTYMTYPVARENY